MTRILIPNRSLSHGIHGTVIFTYIWVDLFGKCEKIYHTWILWVIYVFWDRIGPKNFYVNSPLLPTANNSKFQISLKRETCLCVQEDGGERNCPRTLSLSQDEVWWSWHDALERDKSSSSPGNSGMNYDKLPTLHLFAWFLSHQQYYEPIWSTSWSWEALPLSAQIRDLSERIAACAAWYLYQRRVRVLDAKTAGLK